MKRQMAMSHTPVHIFGFCKLCFVRVIKESNVLMMVIQKQNIEVNNLFEKRLYKSTSTL